MNEPLTSSLFPPPKKSIDYCKAVILLMECCTVQKTISDCTKDGDSTAGTVEHFCGPQKQVLYGLKILPSQKPVNHESRISTLFLIRL